MPETKSVELSYVAEDGTVLQAATYRDFDLNYGLNTDSSVMLNFDGYTLKDVIVNNSQTVSADQASLSVTSDLASVQFVYKKVITETENQTTEPCKTEEKNEDDAEADPNPETEVKEELPEYPAFDQSEVAGDVVVHATAAEGVLPRDSKLVVKRITRKAILNAVEETVSEKNMEVESAVALDVTIQSKDGVEIQPNGFVNISFENVATTAQETNVYHVTNDASTVTEVATNAQSFDADHFSIYVITNENQVPLTTFNFVANGTTVSTQIVKSGDTLIAPTAPDMIGQAFVGWVDEAGNSFTGFGKQAEITETTTRTITARYEAALYVYFLNPDGSQIMRTEKVGDHEAHDFTTVSYEVDSTHKLVGWAAKKNGTENIADKISVPADQTSVNVYAIIKEGYWVSFNSDGGSIVDSQFVLHGDNLVLDKSTTPTKPGYSFDGWYNGLTKVEKGATVTSPMTLTAHWKAAKVSYTVIHWWENADNDEYSFHESQELQGLTGATTTAAAKSYTIKGKNIHGKDTSDKVFTATTIEQKTIKGDGSTIVNVYYKRKTYTMHFKKRQYSRTDLSTITKKWGQSISKKEWPAYNGNGNWQISDSRYLAYTSTMPMNDSTLWSTSGYYTHKAYYYVRNIEDTNYELHHTDVIKSSSDYLTIGKEDCYAITGFTYSHGNPGVDGEYNNSKFYYTRNSYSLRFINNGKQDKTVSKKYEQSISNENYTPARPSSLPDYYEFDGWYDNELCEGEKYVFNGKTMPAQNITLYAKWTAKKISLTYNLNNPEGTVDKGTKKVAAGTIASTVLPSASAIEGYSFAGWYVADENGHMTNVAFNANDAILKDTNVIGKWLYNGELKVKYVADGVEAPKDNNVYAGGAKATVANGVTKEGKKFLGWQLDGNVYQPGQNFEVNKDLADDNVITLTAVFGDSETSAILTYHPGNGNGEDQSDAILNNKEVTLENTSDLSYTAPGEDYYFAGWATSMEDAQKGNAKYAVGEKVRVNADSSNDLYATWVKKTVIEVTANSNTLQYNGEVQKVEGIKDVTAGYEVTGLTAEAEGKDFGTYDAVITGTAKVTKDGVDVTDKVIVNKINGTLTISKRDVTLTSGSASRVYNKEELTNGEVTVSGDGFAKNEGATYTVTGSQTEVGESDNTFTYELKSNTKASNYNITKKEGTLSITPVTDEVTVTIKGNSKTTPYNGTVQSVGGYTVESISNTLYTSTDFTLNGQAMATGKDAAKYPMNLDATQFVNKNTNFSNVKFEIAEDGQLVINPRAVTLTSEKASKPYDGTPLTRPDVKVEGNFVDGEVTEVKATGSVTYVSDGEVTNTIVITKGENFKESNYSITMNEGKLSITKVNAEVTVTIKGKKDTVTYDGQPHSVEGYEITDISNKLYTKDDVKFTGQAKAEGTEAGTYKMNLTAQQFSNISQNFTNVEFVVEDGSLKINPKSITPDGPDTPEEKKTGITVTAPEGSKYDGEEHKNKPTVTDTKTDKVLVEGTDYTLAYSDDVINAGTVTVTVKGIGNYSGETTTTYQITKRNVTLTSGSASRVYNKEALTNGEVTVSGEGFAKDEGATYTVTGSRIKVGSSKNTFTYELKENTKASNYNIEVKFGDLIVTAEDGEVVVTITGHSDSVEYDGNEKTVSGYDVAITEGSKYTTSDFTFNGTAGAKGTKAGTYPMGLNADQFTNTNDNYTQVTFIVNDGSLTISPKSITPDGPDTPDEKKTGITVTDPEGSKYDGEEHKNKPKVEDTKTKATLKEGKDYELSYSEDVVNAGTVTVTVTGIGNYEGSFEVTYEITKRHVTLTSADAEKVYDGSALTNDTVTVGGDKFAKKEGATYNVTGMQIEKGSSKNAFTYTLNEGTLAGNYDIETFEGTLKVTAFENEVVVTIKGNKGTVTYDGNPHSVEGYEVTNISNKLYKENDIGFTGEAKAEGTAAGTYQMNLTAQQFSNISQNFTNVEFVVEDGSLKINPKSITPDGPDTPEEKKTGITVTAPEGSKYDGEEHKNKPTVTDTKTDKVLVEGTDYTLAYSDDVINAGTVTVTVKGIGNYKGSFEVTYEITKRNVTLTSESASKVYDKTALTKDEVTVSGEGFAKNEGATYTVTGSRIKVGSSKNTFTYELKENTKASNYNIEVKFGDLIVTAEDGEVVVTITGHSDSVEYDGNEKAVSGYEVAITEGSKYTTDDFTFNGNAEAKGTEAGTYPMNLAADKFTNTNDNYKNVRFVVNDGSLTITPKSINPEDEKTGITVTDPINSTYDGNEHINGLTVTDSKLNTTLVENTDYTLTYSGDLINVGTVTITIKGIGNYTGEFTKPYQILPREYTVTTNTDSKVYDGNPLTAGGTVNNLVDGETVGFTMTGSQTDVGTSDNTYELNWTGSAKESNYKHGKDSIGTLTVTKKSIVPDGPNTPDEKKTGITVTAPEGSKYDGEEHKNKPKVEDTKTKATLKEGKDYELSYSEDVVNAGTVTVTVTGIGNYEGSFEVTYEITKRHVTLTSADAEKVYDGSALTNDTVTVGGDKFAKKEGATYNVTGMQIEKGSSKNAFTYTLNEGTLAGNYDIETFEGTLKVTAFENEVVVTIKGNKDTVTYDGNPHSVEGYVITDISNKLYKADYIGVKGYARAEGTEAGTYQMNLTAQQFSNTSTSFDKVTFKVEDGSLTISPKSITPDGPDTPDEKKTGITVTKPSDSKYDGEEHKNKPTVTDTKTDRTLVEGTDYELSYSEDVINAGTVTVTVTGIGNYEGSFEVTYEITKRNVTLTSGSAAKVYDKTALTKDEVTVSGDGFAKDEGATYKVTGSRTKVGTSKNTFTYELKSNTTASNYNIEVKFGELKVTAQDGEVVVTITGRSDTVEYDGNEKSVSGYDATITEGSKYTTDDFTFNGTAEAKGTEAGTYSMGLNADQFTNTNDNYTQVTFIVNDGTLTINPKSITPDGPDTPKEEKTGITVTDPENSIYDGNEHINGLTVTDSKLNTTLVENTDYSLTYSGDLINVGTVTITIKGIGNYTGEFTKTYQILPREYTVTTNSDSKVYDGTALTAGGTVNNLVDGETVGFTITGSQTNVGTSDNTYELNWTGTARKANYKHGKDSIGTLTVTKQSIAPDPEHPETYKEVTITSPSDEVYDGKEHKWIPTVTDKEENELVAKTDYEVTYSTTDFTNVTGTITVTITGIGNYTGKATRTYSITPKTYTVTTESDSKVYDGTALTAGGKVGGIVKGETVDFTITGSQTSVGTSDNTYELNWTGSAKESNYKHGKDSIGTLTVKAKSIVPDGPDTPDEKKTGITASDPSDSKYDGKEHREVLTVQDTKKNDELVAEKDYSVTYSDDLVNAGTVTITIEGIGNYTGSFTKTYEITKRSVTLTSATASKTYDGQALTSTSITVSGDGFVEGEGATYNVTGTQTEVGNSANSFEYKLNENTLASNYDITKVVGTLTVTRDTTPVTPAPTPTTPSVPPVVQRVVPAPTPVPEEKVEEEQTPKAEPKEEEKVEEDYTPKATQEYYWALINLICAIVTVLFGLLLLISKRHKDEDDEEEDDETKQQATTNEDEEQEQEKKRGLFTRVLAVLIAIVSVVFFLVTEDMSLAWTWTDQWTIWMVVIGLVQIAVFFVGRKWKNVDNDDENEEAQQA